MRAPKTSEETSPDRRWLLGAAMSALVMAAALTGLVAYMVPASGQGDGEAAPIYGIKIPPGYRDWRLISVAREEGNFNDLRAQLGNDVAIKAYREGTLPFPDGTIIAALHWNYDSSEENNKVFGRVQSFVAGTPKNIQFMVKDKKNTARRAAGGLLATRPSGLDSFPGKGVSLEWPRRHPKAFGVHQTYRCGAPSSVPGPHPKHPGRGEAS